MDQQELMSRIDTFIKENEAAMVQDIAALVAVRSLEGPAAPGAPFGEGPRQALDKALEIAGRLGFETHNDDGYLGWAQLPGREEGYLATITHLDIVPEGEGWDGDPLVLRQRDGWLLGRGAADDKGPSVACLYTAKFIKENNLPLRYGLRVLLGCNEESGMADVSHYLAGNPQPLFCFSPDAGFPVCNGEKGMLAGRFISGPVQGNLAEFEGGVATNVIPDRAFCVVRHTGPAPAGTDRISATAENGLLRLEATGIGGHAASPAGTVNAIGLLVGYLLDNGLCSESEQQFLQLLRRLHSATDGSGVGVACSDDKFDPLTCIGGEINLKDGHLEQSINIRYPTATSKVKLDTALSAAAAQHGATFKVESAMDPFYIEADSAPITALLGAYRAVTGRDDKPFTMGGGTYARHFANAVSYGPGIPGTKVPDFAGDAHAPNEGCNLPMLLQAMKVYILAVLKLQEVDF